MSNSEFVFTEFHQGVLIIKFNRPKANAFNDEMVLQLQAALKHATNDHHVRCIMIMGTGAVFSAGQDVTVVLDANDYSYRQHLKRTYNPIILQIRQMEKPVLAAINGSVAGAGLGIALACDLRIAADDSRFIVGFLGIGLSLDSAVSLLLPALIGLGRASEYVFTNKPINAEQALQWGLVNRLTPAKQLSEQAIQWAVEIAHGPVYAMGLAKRNFNKAVLGNLKQVLDYEAYNQETAGKAPEHQEGLGAFLEKRVPRYPDIAW